MIRFVLLFLLSAPAMAADLFMDWEPVNVDDTGAPLPSQVEEYRVRDCAGVLIAAVPGDTSEYLEADAVTGTGTYCRQVTAYLTPLESAPLEGTLVVVRPGAPTNLTIQALAQ